MAFDAQRREAVCPVLATAQIISGKWTLLVLRDLAEGPVRFGELQRSLAGISPRTLSQRLRSLEEEGVVERFEYAEVPPRVEYCLTTKGEALLPIVAAMRVYGEAWLGVGDPTPPALGLHSLASAPLETHH